MYCATQNLIVEGLESQDLIEPNWPIPSWAFPNMFFSTCWDPPKETSTQALLEGACCGNSKVFVLTGKIRGVR